MDPGFEYSRLASNGRIVRIRCTYPGCMWSDGRGDDFAMHAAWGLHRRSGCPWLTAEAQREKDRLERHRLREEWLKRAGGAD